MVNRIMTHLHFGTIVQVPDLFYQSIDHWALQVVIPHKLKHWLQYRQIVPYVCQCLIHWSIYKFFPLWVKL